MSPEVLEKDKKAEQVLPKEIPQDIGNAALQLCKEHMPESELKDTRVSGYTLSRSPLEVWEEVPQSQKSAETVKKARQNILDILRPKPSDDRLLVIVGPCSIHDIEAGEEYAQWLSRAREKHDEDLEIVMRVYFEKPRTTIGWKGLINEPGLDGKADINNGRLKARQLLEHINSIGVPAATEILDKSTPQYIADQVSYGAIGARDAESHTKREMVSALSFPVGFKNGTGGSIKLAIDAIKTAAAPHNFPGLTPDGRDGTVHGKGNPDCNIILRGSSHGPNYDKASIERISKQMEEAGVSPSIVVDVSHGNSGKDYLAQVLVAENVANQIGNGNRNIRGVMIESFLVEGKQDHVVNGGIIPRKKLVYGQSITDACIDLSETRHVLENLADSVRTRRHNS